MSHICADSAVKHQQTDLFAGARKKYRLMFVAVLRCEIHASPLESKIRRPSTAGHLLSHLV